MDINTPYIFCSDAPLLYDLMNAIAKPSVAQSALLTSSAQNQAAVSSLFQIPLEEERAALCFFSKQLVCLVTEHTVYWQKVLENKPPFADILTSQYVQIDKFLTIEEKNNYWTMYCTKLSRFCVNEYFKRP